MSSEDVATDGIFAVYSIEDDGQKLTAFARFYAGSNENGTVIELSAGDTVSVNGEELNLNKSFTGGATYVKSMGDGQSFTFRFSRQSQEEPEAYQSTVSLSAPMIITSPEQQGTYLRGQALRVRWNPGDDKINLEISGKDRTGKRSFIRNYLNLDDDGSFFIKAADLDPPEFSGSIYNFTVAAARNSSGKMDPKLKGRINALSVDRVSAITLTE